MAERRNKEQRQKRETVIHQDKVNYRLMMKSRTVRAKATRERPQPIWLMYMRICWSFCDSGTVTCAENTDFTKISKNLGHWVK